ncbi:cysteine--tRNA ligase [Ferrovibrio sp.]|uniref:cysteine--tRNA ligase n=1 Tax=Ferrovibrio sp. TaxID=1917215 RepID=UPI001B5C6701|nr:cysteine--tRNA ligase [Ferrovibrio sp.]MBP7064778.1 cysteine--tRNA ligase [Ferrovibrio sp.]
MAIQLYNTLSRRKEAFVPLAPNRVTMYVCGPTVYNFAHIGNARPAVAFDVLYRLLQKTYPQVVYVRNVTDVDDKINNAAKAEGVPIGTITERYLVAYHADMAALAVLPPGIEPKVTQHIGAIISMIERLIGNGHAYAAEGHVLFNVPSFKEYGGLSRRDRDEMIAGARVDVAPYKQDPSDFVLWKPSSAEMPGWDSPWGRGRPGWHIECSAMIDHNLGSGPIDIHGGGHDLIFPHHENEIAQSTCANKGSLGGQPFARYWLHNGFVNVDAEKMSKSLGNVLLVRDLIGIAPGEAIRLALLAAHYRQPLDWTEAGMREAKAQLDRLYRALDSLKDVAAAELPAPQAFIEALSDDLNTPKALAELHAIANAANKATVPAERARLKGELLAAGWLIGLLQQEPAQWLQGGSSDETAEIEAAIAARKAARAAKNWAESDRIRDEWAARGILLEDKGGETTWRRA